MIPIFAPDFQGPVRARRRSYRPMALEVRINEASDFHLGAQLNDPVGRDAEIVCRIARIARHSGEQVFTPWNHALARRRNHGLPDDEKRCFHHFEWQSIINTHCQYLGNIWLVLESVMHVQLVALVAEWHDIDPVGSSDPRLIGHIDRQEYDALMQDLVV